MEVIARVGLSSLHHLFINHAINKEDIFGNSTVENELFSSIMAYCDCISKTGNDEEEKIKSFIEDIVIRELLEGCYFDNYSVDYLKTSAKESIYLISGIGDGPIVDNYLNYIDKAYEKYTKGDFHRRSKLS